MTADQKKSDLFSASNHKRLKAARLLARNPNEDQLPHIMSALRKETDVYVKETLQQALSKLENTQTDTLIGSGSASADNELSSKAIERKATEQVTKMLLHEIGKHVGQVAYNASQEIHEYEGSATKLSVSGLQGVLRCIEALQTASGAAEMAEMELGELVHSCVSHVEAAHRTGISEIGAKPLIITSDWNLLYMAVSNAIKNALESVVTAEEFGPHCVVVNWGETDTDYYVNIIDKGKGLPPKFGKLFSPGITSKDGHLGFGLAIARQAIHSLNGTIHLANNVKHPGAICEIRWEKQI